MRLVFRVIKYRRALKFRQNTYLLIAKPILLILFTKKIKVGT